MIPCIVQSTYQMMLTRCSFNMLDASATSLTIGSRDLSVLRMNCKDLFIDMWDVLPSRIYFSCETREREVWMLNMRSERNQMRHEFQWNHGLLFSTASFVEMTSWLTVVGMEIHVLRCSNRVFGEFCAERWTCKFILCLIWARLTYERQEKSGRMRRPYWCAWRDE